MDRAAAKTVPGSPACRVGTLRAGSASRLSRGSEGRDHQAQAANVRRVVSAVFNWARSERGTDGEYLVADNPVTRTKPVKIERETEDVDPLTADEARRVIAAACAGWERRIVTVALGAGLRPNENFGLKRANIDLEARVIRIRQTYSRYGQGGVKNARSRCDVHMSEPVYQACASSFLTTSCEAPGSGR